MWARRLLLTVALLGLFAGGRSQGSFGKPVLLPGPPIDDPVDTYDSSKDTSTPEERPSCNYVIASGLLLISGSEAPVCVVLEKCSQPVNISFTLEFYNKKVIIANANDVQEFYTCQNISVPETSKADIAVLSLLVSGANIDEQSRKQVVIVPTQDTCVALQDKPLYKRSDTINVKWVCYDQDLGQVNKNFTNMTFWDPMGNGLTVVRDLQVDHGVVAFEYQFSSNCREGSYELRITDDKGATYSTYLQVQDYNLPKWTVTTQCPGPISVMDRSVEINGTAQYSYGKPVPGIVLAKCCRNWPRYGKQGNCFKGVPDLCRNYTVQMDENGNFNIPMSLEDYKVMYSGPENYISCDVIAKENGTDELKTSYCYMWISDRPANIQLDYDAMGKYYNVGPIPFSATLTDGNNVPIPFATITVTVNGKTKKVKTDKDGKASCLIRVTDFYGPNLTLTAIYDDPDQCLSPSYSGQQYASAEIVLYRYFSWSGSYIRLIAPQGEIPVYSEISVTVKYWLTEEGCGKGETSITLLLLIKGKNRLVRCIKSSIDVTQGYEGQIEIKFYADEKLSTNAQILAIVMLKKELIAYSISINVGLGFRNQMTLAFEKAIAKPGETVNQAISAAPDSFCALVGKNAAFDQISYNNFNPLSIIYAVITYSWGLQYGEFNLEDPVPPCYDPNSEIYCNGGYYIPTSSYTDDDAYTHMKESGIVMSSNEKYRRLQVCGEEQPPLIRPFFDLKASAVFDSAVGGGSANTVITIRSRLDDTFVIKNTVTDQDGKAIVAIDLPESIAKWEVEGFCVSPTGGLGLPLSPSSITTFQEFFVGSEFPSKATVGEKVYYVVKVNNYMNQCAQVQMGILPSDDDALEVTPLDDNEEQCACSGQAVFRTFLITCNKIGIQNITTFGKTTKISDTCDGPPNSSLPNYEDQIVQSITVGPLGIPRSAFSGFLISVNESTVSVTISVPQPINLEPDTWQMQIICTGDTVTLSLQNLKQLMDMPSGCCEQQASLLTTVAIITNYLITMGQIDDDTLKSVKMQMQQSYSDQLACISGPGVCSLYRSTVIQNTMVTMLTFQAFELVKPFVYVDDNVQSSIALYLASIQDLETGCIKPEGRPLIYQADKNYTIRINAMTVNLLSSALQSYSAAVSVFEGATKCIKDVNFGEMDAYTQVTMLRAFAVTGQWSEWESGYIIVSGQLTNRDGQLYLKDPSSQFGVYNMFTFLTTYELITTSHLLASMTLHPNPSQEQINTMAALAATLFSATNARGVYSSTQSTACVMDAVTSYKEKYGTKTTDAEIDVVADNSQIVHFSISNQNKFIAYTEQVDAKSGNYTFQATGTGSIFCQVSTTYCTKVSKGEDAAFSVTVTATAPECFDVVAKVVNLEITISYTGANAGCGMTVVAVKCLTGYQFDYNWNEWSAVISDVDGDYGGTLNLYVDHFGSDPVTWKMSMYRLNAVGTMQDSTVIATAFDTGESGYASYAHPCYNRNLAQD